MQVVNNEPNMNDVLVVVAGHVTDEEKKDYVVQLLDILKKENLNLCYVTHASNYLEELSKKVDFLYYDKNNLLVDHVDYLTHCDLFDETSYAYGHSEFWTYLPFGKIIINGIAEHCPALTILLKNAIDIANTNRFKWIVFMEYDIIPPKDGFLQFIKDKLTLLTENNKKCLLYPRPDEGFMYPGILIFTPEDILKHPVFLQKNWYSSKENWISIWKLGFSESITQNVLNSVFEGYTLESSIADDAKKYWNINDYSKIHIYSQFDKGHHQTIRLVPYKKDNKYILNLFMFNMNNFVLHISTLTVYNKSKNTTIYTIKDKYMNSTEWYIDALHESLYDSTDIIELQYTLNIDGMTTEKLFYDMKYIDNIHNYLCRFESN